MGSSRQHRIVDDQQLSDRQEVQSEQEMDSHDDIIEEEYQSTTMGLHNLDAYWHEN